MRANVTRRTFLMGLSGAAGMMVLAACAPKAAPTAAPAAEAGGAAATAAPKPAAKEEVKLFSLGTGRQEIWDAFHGAGLGISIENVPITGDKFEKLNSMFASGDPPDLFNTSDVNWCKDRELALAQHVELDGFIERDAADVKWDDIYPTVTKYMLMPDGHYYFMPNWANSNVMAYNIDLFDEVGVPYPTSDWTWDDMVQAGKELTKRDGDMIIQYGKVTTFGWWGEYYYYQRQAGLENWLSDDGETVFMDEPAAMEGLQFYLDCITKHDMADRPGQSLDGGFMGGGYAMWNFIHTGSMMPITEAGLKWDIMVPPQGTRRDGGEFALDSTAIGKGSKHVEESWSYLKWNTGDGGGRAWASVGVPPIRKSLAEETWLQKKGVPEYPLHPERYYEAMPYNMTVHWPPGSWDAWDILQKKVDLILEEKLSIEEGCKQAADEMRKLIASGGKS